MRVIFNFLVYWQYRQLRRLVLAEEYVQLKAASMYRSLIAPMHDWRGESVWRFARQIAVAARLKSDFGLSAQEDHCRLGEVLRMRLPMLSKLPEETIILLRYLIEGSSFSWSVYVEYEVREMKHSGREIYTQMFILSPLEV